MKRHKSGLVSQYLENISQIALEKYQKTIRDYVHRKHGVYALYKKNKLYYVGLASNLKSRLRHHLRDRHAGAWDSFSIYLTDGRKHLHELETLLLRIIDRKGDRQRGKFGKAEDLKKKLKNDFKRTMSIELENLLCSGKSLSSPKIRERIKSIEEQKGRQPTLALFITRRIHIRFSYKNKLYIAHVRKDGSITFASESAESRRLQGKVFTSPSLAASAVTHRPMNGWKHWKYERSPGKWVALDELRK